MNELQRLNGQEAAVPTLIGEAPTRFAIGGKIRAGIKVLTAAAAREREAQAIFECGCRVGQVVRGHRRGDHPRRSRAAPPAGAEERTVLLGAAGRLRNAGARGPDPRASSARTAATA